MAELSQSVVKQRFVFVGEREAIQSAAIFTQHHQVAVAFKNKRNKIFLCDGSCEHVLRFAILPFRVTATWDLKDIWEGHLVDSMKASPNDSLYVLSGLEMARIDRISGNLIVSWHCANAPSSSLFDVNGVNGDVAFCSDNKIHVLDENGVAVSSVDSPFVHSQSTVARQVIWMSQNKILIIGDDKHYDPRECTQMVVGNIHNGTVQIIFRRLLTSDMRFVKACIDNSDKIFVSYQHQQYRRQFISTYDGSLNNETYLADSNHSSQHVPLLDDGLKNLYLILGAGKLLCLSF